MSFIFQFFESVLPLLLAISKIEAVKLKYIIIAKMDLKVIENGLQNNFQIQHWRHENTPNVGGSWTPFRVPQNFWSKRKRRVLRTIFSCFLFFFLFSFFYFSKKLGHLPLTRKGRVGCSALSSLRSLGFFECSILAFSIFDFDISICVGRRDHLGYFLKWFSCAWHI